jgi:hypothetical protein
MNSAEHIRTQVRWLAEEDRITREQLVEIIEELLEPFCGVTDPLHFHSVNAKVHRLRAVSNPNLYEPDDA